MNTKLNQQLTENLLPDLGQLLQSNEENSSHQPRPTSRPLPLGGELRAILGRSTKIAQSANDQLSDSAATNPNGQQTPINHLASCVHELKVSVSQVQRGLENLNCQLKDAISGINSQLALNARDVGIRAGSQTRQSAEVSDQIEAMTALRSEQVALRDFVSNCFADLRKSLARTGTAINLIEQVESNAAALPGYDHQEYISNSATQQQIIANQNTSPRFYESIFYGAVIMLLMLIAAMQVYSIFNF